MQKELAQKNRFKSPIFWILLFSILFYCLDYYFRLSPSLVVPQLMRQYGTGTLGVGSFASAFYLGYFIFQIPSGVLFDRGAFHQVFVPAIFVCSVAYAAFLYSNFFIAGYLLRLIIGATSAFSFVGVLFIARHYFPSKWFSFITGSAIAAGSLTASLAQVSSAYLMRYFNWRLVLAGYAFSGVLIGFVIFSLICFVKRTERRTGQKKFVSMDAMPVKKSLCYFFSHEVLCVNAIIGGLFYLPTTIFAALWGISFLQVDYGLSRTGASLGIAMIFLGWAIGSPFIGMLADRVNQPKHLLYVGAFLAFMVSVPMIYSASMVGGYVYLFLFLFGLFSSAQVVVWKVFRDQCSSKISGLGVALTNKLIMIFGTVFHLLVGWLLSYGVFTEKTGEINYHAGLSIIPLAFASVLFLTFFLKIKPRNPKKPKRFTLRRLWEYAAKGARLVE